MHFPCLLARSTFIAQGRIPKRKVTMMGLCSSLGSHVHRFGGYKDNFQNSTSLLDYLDNMLHTTLWACNILGFPVAGNSYPELGFVKMRLAFSLI